MWIFCAKLHPKRSSRLVVWEFNQVLPSIGFIWAIINPRKRDKVAKFVTYKPENLVLKVLSTKINMAKWPALTRKSVKKYWQENYLK